MIIQVNQQELNSLISRLGEFGTKITTGAILEQLAVKVKNTIFLKTQAGRDADGRQFAPYSAPYQKREGKTFVNLTKTGHLLNAMTQKVLSNNTAKVFFENYKYPNGLDVQELAKIHDQKGAGRRRTIRHFFGVDETDMQDLVKTYEAEVDKIKAGLKL